MVYVGDGGNDFCPSASLTTAGDVVLARRGFRLAKKIRSLRSSSDNDATADADAAADVAVPAAPTTVAATVVEWGDWKDLARELRALL